MSTEDSKASDQSRHDEHALEDESTGREVAIQTNPHEIERSQGQLPLRKRFIPLRFSDYGIFSDNVKDDDEDIEVVEDTDFLPTEVIAKQTLNNQDNKPKRSRGRPRKKKDATDATSFGEGKDIGHDNVKRNPITKVSNGFKCGICNKIFTLRGNAKTHLITHTDERPFQCDFKDCGKNLRTKEGLRRHRLSHLGIKTFECSECNKKFSSNLSLQEHMNLHSGQKPLSCGVCGTNFRQIAVLKRHLATHSNNKPFACEICGKTFSLKVYVRSHMKTHTGERPFSCDICNKCFAHASDLNRHKIIHSGKKPYQCSVCPMRYSDPSSRRRHEREHESKPQYVCHICKQQFPRSGQLRVHLVKEHTTATAPLEQHSIVQVPIKIEATDTNGKSLAWDPNVESSNRSGARVMNLQPALVQTTLSANSDSITGVGLGQEMNTVQIVLDSSCAGQIGNGKGIMQAPLQNPLQGVESGNVQTLVMELPQNSDDFPGLPVNGATYKVIDTGSQIFEIQVEKEASHSAPFQVQELSSELKINVSDLKMNDGGLVAFIQDGDTVTVMEQADETSLQAQSSGVEKNNIILSDGEKVLDNSNRVVLDNVSAIKKDEERDIDLVGIPFEQQENMNLISHAQNAVDNCLRTDASQADTTLNKTESDNDNQNTDELFQHAPKNFVNSNDKDNSLDEINSKVIAVPSVPSTAIFSPYIDNPDLNSQDYYNWLSSFSEECKHFSIPLSKEVFTKISQVQKTLSDFMAMPTGVITDKNNFKILMGITQDLSQITSSHLSLMYSNLNM